MIAAGLLAKKAVEKGLTVPPHVKTSLAPGSRVVTDYFEKAGLDTYLDKLGFYTVGYGCTTCIGNSGPLPEPISQAVKKNDLVVAGVLSGNRNFEGRINPDVKANYLASPPLVVAYALAGTTDIDFDKRTDRRGHERHAGLPARHLADARRSASRRRASACCPRCSRSSTATSGTRTRSGTPSKRAKANSTSGTRTSTYIQEPPFLVDLAPEAGPDPADPRRALPGGARRLGDDRPHLARRFDRQRRPRRQVSHGARRRAARLQQLRRPPRQRPRDDPRHVRQHPHPQPARPRHRRRRHATPAGRRSDVDLRRGDEVQSRGRAAVVLAGAEYGTGSSRDWAAKGTFLLGVRAVIAASFERIHRSNLVVMGVLPLEFAARRNLAIARPHRRRSLRLPRPQRRPPTAADAQRRRHVARRQDAKSSTPPCASTRRSNSTTTATAASCRPCCGSC